MTEDNIESLWRKVMNSSADNCPMEFARALAMHAEKAEREACAELMERQHAWISNVAAAALIRTCSIATPNFYRTRSNRE